MMLIFLHFKREKYTDIEDTYTGIETYGNVVFIGQFIDSIFVQPNWRYAIMCHCVCQFVIRTTCIGISSILYSLGFVCDFVKCVMYACVCVCMRMNEIFKVRHFVAENVPPAFILSSATEYTFRMLSLTQHIYSILKIRTTFLSVFSSVFVPENRLHSAVF